MCCAIVICIATLAFENIGVKNYEDWEMSIYSYDFYSELVTTKEVVAYDGAVSAITHENIPVEEYQYIIIDILVENTKSTKDEFDLEAIQLNVDGVKYNRLDNGFIVNHDLLPLPMYSVTTGKHRGNIIFEVPIEFNSVELVYKKSSYKLDDLVTNGAEFDYIESTNITEYQNKIDRQKSVDETIATNFENNEYTLENPMIIQNPYGATPLSALVLFETTEESEVTIIVNGKDEYTTIENRFEGFKTVHQVPIVGLYADYNNVVTIQVANQDGKIDSKIINIQTEKLSENTPVFSLNSSEPERMEDGMTFLAIRGEGFTVVDANGDIRWYYDNNTGDSPFTRLENGNMILVSDYDERPERGRLLEIDLLGKIHNSYYASSRIHHDAVENTNGNFLVSIGSGYEEIHRETGEVVHKFDTESILPNEMNSYYKNNVPKYNEIYDWVHHNTNFADGNYVYLSPRNQDIVIKIEQYTNEIQWILGEPTNIPEELKEYWLQPVGEVKFQTGQHSPERMSDLDNDTNTIDLMVFDNNFVHVRGNEGVSEQYSGASHFRIDEAKMTVEQIWHFGPQLGPDYHTEWHGDADYLQNTNNVLVTISAGGTEQPREITSILEGVEGEISNSSE